MARQVEFGCKKCGGVIIIETQSWMDRVEFKTKDGKIQDSFGRIEIQCKKCGKAVAIASLNPA